MTNTKTAVRKVIKYMEYSHNGKLYPNKLVGFL